MIDDGSVNMMVRNVPRVIASLPVEPEAPSSGPPAAPIFSGGSISQSSDVLDLLTVNIVEPAEPGANVSLYALAPQTIPEPETQDWEFIGFAWESGIQTTDFLSSYISIFSDTFGPALWLPLKAITTVTPYDSEPTYSALGTPPSSPTIETSGALSSSGDLTQLDVTLEVNGEDNTTDHIYVSEAQSSSSPQPTAWEFAVFYPYSSGGLLSAYAAIFGDSVPAGYYIWVRVIRISDFDPLLASGPVYESIFVD